MKKQGKTTYKLFQIALCDMVEQFDSAVSIKYDYSLSGHVKIILSNKIRNTSVCHFFKLSHFDFYRSYAQPLFEITEKYKLSRKIKFCDGHVA